MPSRIVRFVEKHEDSYYDASTDELYRQALAAVFRERWELGYYYGTSEPKPYLYLSPDDEPYRDLSDDQIEALPESLKDRAKKVQARKIRAAEENESVASQWRMAKRFYEKDCPPNYTFKSGDRKYYFITMFMRERSAYEYERFELINLETA